MQNNDQQRLDGSQVQDFVDKVQEYKTLYKRLATSNHNNAISYVVRVNLATLSFAESTDNKFDMTEQY